MTLAKLRKRRAEVWQRVLVERDHVKARRLLRELADLDDRIVVAQEEVDRVREDAAVGAGRDGG